MLEPDPDHLIKQVAKKSGSSVKTGINPGQIIFTFGDSISSADRFEMSSSSTYSLFWRMLYEN